MNMPHEDSGYGQALEQERWGGRQIAGATHGAPAR